MGSQMHKTWCTHWSRWRIDGSIHTTASALICSRSNSSLVRTSSSSTLKFGLSLHSCSVFGKSVLNGSSDLSAIGVDGIAGDLGTLVLRFEL